MDDRPGIADSDANDPRAAIGRIEIPQCSGSPAVHSRLMLTARITLLQQRR